MNNERKKAKKELCAFPTVSKQPNRSEPREENKSVLSDLGSEIFKDSGEIDGCARTDALCVLAVFEEPGYTADRELETGLAAPSGGLLGGA
jgi:hypothetical protein